MAAPRQPGQIVHLNAVRAAEREARRVQAWELRCEGFTQRAIATQLNVSVGCVHELLTETLAELKKTAMEGADNWRRLQLDRLDALIAHWLPISRDPRHQECARAAMIVLRAIETQAKLIGLLQPTVLAGALQPEGKTGLKTMDDLAEAAAESPALAVALERVLTRAKKVQPSPPADVATSQAE